MCRIVRFMATDTRYGTMIRRARLGKRMSQEDLALALGVSRSAVNAWERNRAEPRNPVALEQVLGISLGDEAPPPDLDPWETWESRVLSDPALPDELKRWLVSESNAARAASDARRAARAARPAQGRPAG